jgi:hypothetical protein
VIEVFSTDFALAEIVPGLYNPWFIVMTGFQMLYNRALKSLESGF